MADRYMWDHIAAKLIPREDGEWVRYSDLAAARADSGLLTFALAEVEALELQHGAVIDRLKAERDEALARCAVEEALTANQLADVFDCVWNAAIGESHRQQGGIEFASILAESFRAMSEALRALKGDEYAQE